MSTVKNFIYTTTYDNQGNVIPLPKDPKHPLLITPITFDRPVSFIDGKAVDVTELVKAKGTEKDGQRPMVDLNSMSQDTEAEKPKWLIAAAEKALPSNIQDTVEKSVPIPVMSPPPIRIEPTEQIIPNVPTVEAAGNTSAIKEKPKPSKVEAPKAYQIAVDLMKVLPMRVVNEALYVYNGKAYEFVSTTVMHRLIMAYCRAAVSTVGDASVIKRIYEVIQAEPTIFVKEIRNLDLVSFENGLLDLSNFQMHPHTPDVFVTAQVKGEFHPEWAMSCPHFHRFLMQTTGGDSVLIQRIWEAMGYILTPDTRGKAFILFQGVRDSGKSLLGDFISSLLRPEDVTAIPLDELGERFGASDLIGKRLCLSLDLPNSLLDSRSAGMLKSLTGGDLVSADVKYQPRVKFRNTAKFLFASNHHFGTRIPDDALLRRVVTIPFRFSVPVMAQDPALLDKFQTERTAIITKAMLAYRDLRRRGYRFSGDYPVNESIVDSMVMAPPTKAELEKALFIFARSHLVPCDSGEVFVEDLHNRMREVDPTFLAIDSKMFGFMAANVIKQLFPDELGRGIIQKSRKYKSGNANATSVYTGIAMRSTIRGE